MKNILVGLSTFAFGILFVYLFQVKEIKSRNSIEPAQIKKSYKPISDLRKTLKDSESADKNKTEAFKPFFDSFEESEGFDGWFITDNFKGMKEVWAISIDIERANEKAEKLVWSSMIRTKTESDSLNEDDYFHSISITADKSRLSFKTNRIRGIEYKFEGEFSSKFYKFEEGEKVLKGTLQKFIKGKKVAEFTSDFKFYEPHCLH
jgi:hypothetical protein